MKAKDIVRFVARQIIGTEAREAELALLKIGFGQAEAAAIVALERGFKYNRVSTNLDSVEASIKATLHDSFRINKDTTTIDHLIKKYNY